MNYYETETENNARTYQYTCIKGGIREIERTNIRDPVGKHKGIKENKKGKEIVFPSHPNRMRKI